MSQRGGVWRRSYPRPAGADAIGLAAVPWVRGSRAVQRERLARARAEQSERLARTGYVGGAAELANVVRFELRRLGYSPAEASFGAHLCSVGGTWNFQGIPRLAQLVGRSPRSAQRYRAKLEAAGLIRSYCLEPGDMIDGQNAPVSRPHVARDVSGLRGLGLPWLATRPPPPRPKTKAQRRSAARAVATVAPPRPEPAPLTYEQLRELAQRPGAAEVWGPAFVGGRGGAAASKRPQERPAPPPPPTDAELDALDAELRELTEQRERQRERPPDPPPD